MSYFGWSAKESKNFIRGIFFVLFLIMLIGYGLGKGLEYLSDNFSIVKTDAQVNDTTRSIK